MNPKHLCQSQERYTPSSIMEPARGVLGFIHLDPCSNAVANGSVKADQWFTKDDDALNIPWGRPSHPKTVWVNPPGGTLNGKSIPKLFWQKLLMEYHLGHIKHAMFLSFSIESLSVTQKGCWRAVLSYPTCILKDRVRFLDANGEPMRSPTHASAITYIPGHPNQQGSQDNTHLFLDLFRDLGVITRPISA